MCVSLAVISSRQLFSHGISFACPFIFWLFPKVEDQNHTDPTSHPGIPKFADVDIALSIGKDEGKAEYKSNDSDQDSLNVYFHTL